MVAERRPFTLGPFFALFRPPTVEVAVAMAVLTVRVAVVVVAVLVVAPLELLKNSKLLRWLSMHAKC
jgi:hypothetical protein